jgi:hypothetical protein
MRKDRPRGHDTNCQRLVVAKLNVKIPHLPGFEVGWIKQEIVIARSPQGDAAICGQVRCVGGEIASLLSQ